MMMHSKSTSTAFVKMMSRETTTVSYPHLDVYKRQQYYAVERTVVHASDYDYQAVQYAAGVEDGIDIPSEGNKGEIIGNRDGPLTSDSVTEDVAFTQNTLNLSNADYQWADGSTKPGNIGKFNGEGGNTYPQYALLEDGTFINTLANTCLLYTSRCV